MNTQISLFIEYEENKLFCIYNLKIYQNKYVIQLESPNN